MRRSSTCAAATAASARSGNCWWKRARRRARSSSTCWARRNAHLYHGRSDAHDFALDIAEGRDGQRGIARALERFIAHLFGEAVTIRAVPVIEDANWTWHVGLDAEASAIANDLWQGRKVRQERLARIIWLGVLEFADSARVLPRVAGRPVYLALAMDAANRLRMKPQNLVAGLPLQGREDGGMTLEVPGTIRVPVGVVAERRPGVTTWAEHAWAAREVLEDAPDLAPWTVLREDAGRTLFFAGTAEVALHPTDTDNYIHNLQQEVPRIWVVLRPVEAPPGYRPAGRHRRCGGSAALRRIRFGPAGIAAAAVGAAAGRRTLRRRAPQAA